MPAIILIALGVMENNLVESALKRHQAGGDSRPSKSVRLPPAVAPGEAEAVPPGEVLVDDSEVGESANKFEGQVLISTDQEAQYQ